MTVSSRGIELLLLVVVVLAATAGCGSGSSKVVAQGVVTFSETMRDGVIRDPVVNHPNGGNRTCDGTGRYSDMVEGESIVIRDAHGEVVGIGQLSPGATTFRETSRDSTTAGADRGDGIISCSMPFSTPDVAGDSDSYTVAIGDRVPLEHVKRSELESMVLKPRG